MRNMEGYSQQREKLASLGTMAAGLAHELNNPAAAARRAAAHLQETTDQAQALLCQLTRTLDHEQLATFGGRLAGGLGTAREARPRSTTSSAAIAPKPLRPGSTAHGVATAWELAPTFVSADVDIAWLEELARQTCRRPARRMPWAGWRRA